MRCAAATTQKRTEYEYLNRNVLEKCLKFGNVELQRKLQ